MTYGVRVVVVVAVLVALGVPVQAQTPRIDALRALAEQGDAEAQRNLGIMYDNGQGVPQDYAEAARWFRLAADQGVASAQFNLGVMYDDGRGVPQDDVQAVRWYRLAADQGDARAQNELGFMYTLGEGVPQDYVQAHMWLNLAASRSTGELREARVRSRDLIAGQLTPAALNEAQRLARNGTPRTA